MEEVISKKKKNIGCVFRLIRNSIRTKSRLSIKNTTRNEGHAVAAEQKIRELKFRLKNFKRLSKISKNVLKSNVVLKKATNNMNIQPTRKYEVPPNEVEKNQ